ILLPKDGSILSFHGPKAVKRVSNGSLDASFGTGGVVDTSQLPFAFQSYSNNSRGFPALDAQDRVLVTGSKQDNETGKWGTYVARYVARMNLDTSFGSDGTGTTEIGNRTIAGFSALTAGTDRFGRVVIGGQFSEDLWYAEGVTRLQGDSVVANVVEFYNPLL